RCLVRPAQAQQRVTEPLPRERVRRGNPGRPPQLLRGVREFFPAEQLGRGAYQSVGPRPGPISISVRDSRTSASWYARESMSAGVGADVEALCSKCGDVWHVVVAKVGQQIVKVQCKQCSGYHRYKSPHGAPADKKLPATHRPPRESRAPHKAPV